MNLYGQYDKAAHKRMLQSKLLKRTFGHWRVLLPVFGMKPHRHGCRKHYAINMTEHFHKQMMNWMLSEYAQ